MANGGAGETLAGNLRCARLSNVCLWVKRSWDAISDEIIIESFKTCKISTDLNDDLEISDIDNDEFSVNDDDDVDGEEDSGDFLE